jgi:hypothetical protein
MKRKGKENEDDFLFQIVNELRLPPSSLVLWLVVVVVLLLLLLSTLIFRTPWPNCRHA